MQQINTAPDEHESAVPKKRIRSKTKSPVNEAALDAVIERAAAKGYVASRIPAEGNHHVSGRLSIAGKTCKIITTRVLKQVMQPSGRIRSYIRFTTNGSGLDIADFAIFRYGPSNPKEERVYIVPARLLIEEVFDHTITKQVQIYVPFKRRQYKVRSGVDFNEYRSAWYLLRKT